MPNLDKLVISSWVISLLGSIILFWCCLIFPVAIPQLEMIYRDLGIKLPGITELLLDVSHYYIWVLGLVYAIANPFIESQYAGKFPRLVFNIASLFCILLIQGLIIVAAFLPLLTVIENLSQQQQ